MGNSLLNLLSTKTNNSMVFGLPKVSMAVKAALIVLPVYKTSSINTTCLSSTSNLNSVLFGIKTASLLLKSSLKKVISRYPAVVKIILDDYISFHIARTNG